MEQPNSAKPSTKPMLSRVKSGWSLCKIGAQARGLRLVSNWQVELKAGNSSKVKFCARCSKAMRARLTSLDYELKAGIAYVRATYDFPEYAATLSVNYAVNNVGEIVVEQSVEVKGEASDKSLPRLFRFGMLMAMPGDFEHIDYYGRGPVENYADRKSSAFLGLYHQRVDEQPYPYIRPQETGTKSDVRWWQQSGPDGWGLRITSDAPFSASALHYSPEALSCGDEKGQLHFPEIKPDACVWLCIDGVQMGLGCVDSWYSLPREEYRIPYADRTFRFKLTPSRLLR